MFQIRFKTVKYTWHMDEVRSRHFANFVLNIAKFIQKLCTFWANITNYINFAIRVAKFIPNLGKFSLNYGKIKTPCKFRESLENID